MNTLLITADALRQDHIGCYGYHRQTTPTIDAFAKENTRYNNAFANGTFTSSALPAILTGSLRKDSGDALTIDQNLQILAPTIASELRKEGIFTKGINTNLLFYVWYEKIEGFDEFKHFVPTTKHSDQNKVSSLIQQVGKPVAEALGIKQKAQHMYDWFKNAEDISLTAYHDAEAVTDRAINWLRQWEGDDFFLWIHYMDPHEPYGYFDSLRSSLVSGFSLGDEISPSEIEEIAKRAGEAPESVSNKEREFLLHLYDAYIGYLDDNVKRLFGELHDKNIYEQTQIFLTADHGEEFGEHGEYYHSNRPYDELIHVPLLIKSPLINDDVRKDQVRHIDIAPTIAKGHGIDLSPFDGIALDKDCGNRPVVTLGSDRPYFDISAKQFAAIREPNWKFIYHHEQEDELFDIEEDPNERHNLIDEHPDVAKQLREKLLTFITISIKDKKTDGTELDEEGEIKNRLEDLGYL